MFFACILKRFRQMPMVCLDCVINFKIQAIYLNMDLPCYLVHALQINNFDNAL